ncbi:hypothetical protein [Rhizobium leguminosarum]|uniref:COG3904 family protein n=1 Tax=Rhizobium leguminosarum TaxID=384 RepID=UPI0021BBE8D6|nr:hypothetical protein [Rhizobium leguminosarum]
MEFEYTDPQTELERLVGGFYYINAFGRIEPGDDVKFQKLLTGASPPSVTCVYINSIGGDVESAINIGRAIRAWRLSTEIGTYVLHPEDVSAPIIRRNLLPGNCMSAATLLYLGGRLRHFHDGAQFGVHQFSYKNPSPEHVGQSQILSAKIAGYVADMGVSPDFLEISSSTPSNDLKLIDKDALSPLGVTTGGITDVRWTVQAHSEVLYVRGERDSMFGHHKVMLVYAKGSGFLFHAVIEAQGRQTELTEFPLVELVLDHEATVWDISQRALRVVNGDDVNIIVKLDDTEARMIASSSSFGVRVRASGEAPVFLGISPMNTDGGKEQLETFYSVLGGR